MLNQTKIIAHRGASFNAPENTLESVLLSWEQNADAVEIDVMLTKDNRIVVFHDEDTARMTGEAGVLKDKTWQQIQRLKINTKGIKTHIPLLSDILPTIPADKFLVVELKCGPDIVVPLRKLIDEFKIKSQNVQFISLNEKTLQKTLQAFPGYETQRVFEFLNKKPDINYLLTYAEQTSFTGIDLEMGNYLTKDFIQQVHALRKKIYVWTVDNPLDAQHLIHFGIDGITTNRQEWLCTRLRAMV